MKSKMRLENLDITKGIGIILVILGHCVNKGTPVHNWIFSFHMPLFFFISGFCFNLDKYMDFKQLAKNKFKRLILPYIWFCLFGLLVSTLIPQWRINISIKNVLTDIYTGYPRVTHITSTWFLVSLFICMIVWWCINKLFKRDWICYIFILLSGLLGAIISIIHEAATNITNGDPLLPAGRLPLTIDTSFTAFVFFACGNLMRNKVCILPEWLKFDNYKKDNRKLWSIGGLLGINIVLSVFMNTRVNLHGCMEGNIVFFYLSAFAGIFCTTSVSTYVFKGKIFSLLQLLGKHTLLIMGIQSFMINIWILIINSILNTQYTLYEDVPFGYGILGFVIIMIVVILLCFFIGKKEEVYYK